MIEIIRPGGRKREENESTMTARPMRPISPLEG